MRKNYFTLRAINQGVETNICLGSSYTKIDLTKLKDNAHITAILRKYCEHFEAKGVDMLMFAPLSTIIIIPEGCLEDYDNWIVDLYADQSNYIVSANGDTYETLRMQFLSDINSGPDMAFIELAGL